MLNASDDCKLCVSPFKAISLEFTEKYWRNLKCTRGSYNLLSFYFYLSRVRRFKVDYKGRELTKERNGMKFEECNIALCATLAIFIALYSRGYNYSPMGKSNARKIEIKGK